MIEVRNLVFDYPRTRALDGVGFSAGPGEVMALVGPNGAGKSTLMRCIAGLERPLHGEILIDGVNVVAEPRAAHARLGYLADFFGLYDRLTVRRCLFYAARAHGLAPGAAEQALVSIARSVQLEGLLDRLAGELSRGQRQRLAIGQAIIHHPPVLLLDEPAAGLDPEARHALSGLIVELARGGMTLIVSSHILAELEAYATSMLMLKEGRVAGAGLIRPEGRAEGAFAPGPPTTPEPAIRAPSRYAVTFEGAVADLERGLSALGLVVETTASGQTIVLAPPERRAAEILARLVGAGLPVTAFSPVRTTLEDAYLSEIGR